MKRRTIINALMGALAVACLPVAYSRRVVKDEEESSIYRTPEPGKPTAVFKEGDPDPVAVYYDDPERMYVLPGDYPGALGSLVYYEDVQSKRWYACAARERIGSMVRFEVLPVSWGSEVRDA